MGKPRVHQLVAMGVAAVNIDDTTIHSEWVQIANVSVSFE